MSDVTVFERGHWMARGLGSGLDLVYWLIWYGRAKGGGKEEVSLARAIAFQLSPLDKALPDTVIPAKAGIQCLKSAGSCSLASFGSLWTPACAGVTGL